MQIKADEISAIIKEKIEGFDKQVDVKETGSVIQVGDGIAKIYGLDGAMAGELGVPLIFVSSDDKGTSEIQRFVPGSARSRRCP